MSTKNNLIESLKSEKQLLESRVKAINNLLEIYEGKQLNNIAPKELPLLEYPKGTLIEFKQPVSRMKLFTPGKTYKVRNRIEKETSHSYLKYAVKNDKNSISYLSGKIIEESFEVKP